MMSMMNSYLIIILALIIFCKKCIERLMSSTNKFMVKPDKSFEYSLAGFQGSFYLSFITIPIHIRG